MSSGEETALSEQIAAFVSHFTYEDLTPAAPPQLPPRPTVGDDYRRPPNDSQHLVPDVVPQTTAQSR